MEQNIEQKPTTFIPAPAPTKKAIGVEEIRKAHQTLLDYKKGKANLEKRIIDNEQWYKLRHWECMRDKEQNVQPTSAWLFNCIANKHADAMDNFPSPNILPREENDKAEAETLSSIVPVVLEQNDFEETYSEVINSKVKHGTGVYGVFWEKTKLNGLGDISVQEIDIINLFWEPGITDIQNSKNLFHVELADNENLMATYPQLLNKLGGSSLEVSKYMHDDTVDTNKKSAVVDWYYKKIQNGKTVLHYCKYVNDTVLFATENEEKFKDKGLYNHGLYPFVFDALYKVKGTPAGFGYIDISKDAQAYIDRGNQAILKSMLVNAQPRYFSSTNGGINEGEFSDLSKDIIHVDGKLGQDTIIPVTSTPLNDIYVSILNNKIDEMKETTGNRDVSTGGTSGVTAASAIAAMQEAGSKLSRDNNKATYRAFRKVCVMIIELIRQFYDMPRYFRILGENGAEKFIKYTNQGIRPQWQGNDFGQDMGYRVPLFDIEITAQKQSPYSKMSQNEMALQFFGAGFFNPQIADQALACLEMMDFDRKNFVMQRVSQNGTMLQQLLSMQEQMLMLGRMVDREKGTTEVTQQLMMQFGLNPPMTSLTGMINPEEAEKTAESNNSLGGEAKEVEASTTKKARQRVAESTEPM